MSCVERVKPLYCVAMVRSFPTQEPSLRASLLLAGLLLRP